MGKRCNITQRRRGITAWAGVTLGCGLLVSLLGCQPDKAAKPPAWPELTLTTHDRILILAPHPDDEVLGCGGVIQQALAMGLPVHVAFFTYGDNNQWSFLLYRKHLVLFPGAVRKMGLIRHDEALAAARLLGLSPEHLTFLGYPDFGTLDIWESHWGDRPPFESMLTRVTHVPYADALRPNAPYKGEDIVQDLTTVIKTFRPTKIFVSHPSDHMPDHRALYLFTRVALWDVEGELKPDVLPYLIHRARWPKPRGYEPGRWLLPPRALRTQIPWRHFRLGPGMIERKFTALRAHQTQFKASAHYLLSFVRPNELFGDFPVVTLHTSATPPAPPPDGVTQVEESSEELTDVERATFVGVEWRSIQADGDDLVLSVAFSRPLANAVRASIEVFGYDPNTPFAQMPKLHITVGAFNYTVSNQEQIVPNDTVRVIRRLNGITVRVPLQALWNPTRILTSARTYLGDVPLDWVAWRVLELSATR